MMSRTYHAMWKMALALAVGVTMVAGGAPALAAQNGQGDNEQHGQRDHAKVSSQDQQFVDMAAQTNLFEIAAARTALKKTSGKKVRNYANLIIKDHTQAQQQLTRLGQTLGIQVPDKLNEKHQKKVDAMTKLRGEQFRKKFVDANVSGHKEAIQKFQHEAKQGRNKQLKAWATKTVSMLQTHLKHAKQLENGNASNTSKNRKKK